MWIECAENGMSLSAAGRPERHPLRHSSESWNPVVDTIRSRISGNDHIPTDSAELPATPLPACSRQACLRQAWIPAFAGMTTGAEVNSSTKPLFRPTQTKHHWQTVNNKYNISTLRPNKAGGHAENRQKRTLPRVLRPARPPVCWLPLAHERRCHAMIKHKEIGASAHKHPTAPRSRPGYSKPARPRPKHPEPIH